jgi:FkbM family methyltransferase
LGGDGKEREARMIKSAAMFAISKGFKLPQVVDRVDELSRLKALLDLLDVDAVLDVGANTGQFAQELRGIGYDGNIISFEPLRREFDRMHQHFAGDMGWSGHNFALGEVEEDTFINIPNKSVNASLLQAVSGERTRREPMKVKRLDQLIIAGRRLFLKMDTQGFDLKVFAGAKGVLDRIVGLQSELSVTPLYVGMPNYIDALKTYDAAGFKLYNLSVVNRVSDGGLLEMNCLMRR